MATKRRRRTRRKSSTALAAPRRRRRSTGTRRRRSSGLRAGGGSMMATLKGTVKSMALGGLGSIAYAVVSKMLPTANQTQDQQNNNKLIAAGVLGMAAGFFKQPLIAAGIGGAIGTTLGVRFGLLNDDFDNADFVPDTLMMEVPSEYINDNGRFYLADEFGGYREATPMEARNLVNYETQSSLQDGNFDKIYKGWGNPGFY